MWSILERRILYLAICIWVPSPQSTRKIWSSIVTTCAVGWRSKAGRAELFPKIVTASITRFCDVFKVTIFRRWVLPICCIAAKNTSKGLNYLQNVSLVRRAAEVEMDEQGIVITAL